MNITTIEGWKLLIFCKLMGIAIALLSVFAPAGIVLNGYHNGIAYHGFPFAWIGQTGDISTLGSNAASALGSWGYILGLILDVVFWFFMTYLLMWVSKGGKRT